MQNFGLAICRRAEAYFTSTDAALSVVDKANAATTNGEDLADLACDGALVFTGVRSGVMGASKTKTTSAPKNGTTTTTTTPS